MLENTATGQQDRMYLCAGGKPHRPLLWGSDWRTDAIGVDHVPRYGQRPRTLPIARPHLGDVHMDTTAIGHADASQSDGPEALLTSTTLPRSDGMLSNVN